MMKHHQSPFPLSTLSRAGAKHTSIPAVHIRAFSQKYIFLTHLMNKFRPIMFNYHRMCHRQNLASNIGARANLAMGIRNVNL